MFQWRATDVSQPPSASGDRAQAADGVLATFVVAVEEIDGHRLSRALIDDGSGLEHRILGVAERALPEAEIARQAHRGRESAGGTGRDHDGGRR